MTGTLCHSTQVLQVSTVFILVMSSMCRRNAGHVWKCGDCTSSITHYIYMTAPGSSTDPDDTSSTQTSANPYGRVELGNILCLCRRRNSRKTGKWGARGVFVLLKMYICVCVPNYLVQLFQGWVRKKIATTKNSSRSEATRQNYSSICTLGMQWCRQQAYAAWSAILSDVDYAPLTALTHLGRIHKPRPVINACGSSSETSNINRSDGEVINWTSLSTTLAQCDCEYNATALNVW